MGLALIALFLALFVFGFPVVYAILIPAIGYVLIEGLPLGLLTQRITYALDSFPLVAVPIFIFVGNLMNLAGVTDRIFRFADTLVGRLPGGLAQVNIFSSLIFSGMSGAALADVGGLGRIEIEAMRKRGFSAPFAGAVTAASAVVGPIFPPSIPLIVYGSVTSVSIVLLLLAGIVPALICIVLLMITAAVLAIIHKMPRADRAPTLREIGSDLLPALPALFAPVLMIAGMFLDSTTATLLVVPVIAPPLVLAGVDPVHLGIIVIFNLMLGLLTPPMGLSLFLICDIAKITLRQLLRALLPFYVPLLVTLAIITFSADLMLWLPGLLR